MSRTKTERITTCIPCRHNGQPCAPGYALLKQLRAAIAAAGGAVGDDFEISGTVCNAACDRPCRLAYRGNCAGGYLFGDVAEGEDIDCLMALLSSDACEGRLMQPPAAVIALEDRAERLS